MDTDKKQIPIVIPAYEPDKRLIGLLRQFDELDMGPVILINDGSGSDYDELFVSARKLVERHGGVYLTHEVNRGKGRALKTAFGFALDRYGEFTGVVTADSDGQHTPNCIQKVKDQLLQTPGSLVLGVRKFSGKDIPWKSRFGNNLTERTFSYVSGVHVSDTQTGLRGIPKAFVQELLDVPGERFEFEMRMLLEAAGKYEIVEVEIETVYDSAENHQTHFNPVKDSIRIYKILGARFFKFFLSSVSSSLIDLALFTILCLLLKRKGAEMYVVYSTIGARMVSAFYNYCVNYKVVFKSDEKIASSMAKYICLAVGQMLMSALGVFCLVKYIQIIPEVVHKMAVDTILFLVSYKLQQLFVFKRK